MVSLNIKTKLATQILKNNNYICIKNVFPFYSTICGPTHLSVRLYKIILLKYTVLLSKEIFGMRNYSMKKYSKPKPNSILKKKNVV